MWNYAFQREMDLVEWKRKNVEELEDHIPVCWIWVKENIKKTLVSKPAQCCLETT